MLSKDSAELPETIYEPNARQGWLLWAAKQAYLDLSKSSDAVVLLFLRDFVAQFRQRILGYLWTLLGPLLGVASFLFLYFVGVLNPGVEDIPYPIFTLMGTSIWACLLGPIGAVSAGLMAQADLIMRTNIPKLALAVSSLATTLYGVLVGMASMGLVFLLYGKPPTWWFAAYPLLVLPLLVFGACVGLVLSVVGSIARDLTPMVSQGLNIVMFVTPVIYVADSITSPLARTIIAWNPLTYLVDVPRSLVCLGTSPHLETYLWVSLGAFAASLVLLRVFYLLQDLVAERL